MNATIGEILFDYISNGGNGNRNGNVNRNVNVNVNDGGNDGALDNGDFADAGDRVNVNGGDIHGNGNNVNGVGIVNAHGDGDGQDHDDAIPFAPPHDDIRFRILQFHFDITFLEILDETFLDQMQEEILGPLLWKGGNGRNGRQNVSLIFPHMVDFYNKFFDQVSTLAKLKVTI